MLRQFGCSELVFGVSFSQMKVSIVARILFLLFTASVVTNTGNSCVLADDAKGLSDEERAHFVKTKFQPLKTTKDLPAPVRESLGLVADPARMADPGKEWAAGCVGGPDLPHERLILAGSSPDLCFVYFERGGIARFLVLQIYALTKSQCKLIQQIMNNKQFKTIAEIKDALKKKEIQ
jgi:hypothetical protein